MGCEEDHFLTTPEKTQKQESGWVVALIEKGDTVAFGIVCMRRAIPDQG